jgi:predicted metal-dependent hydrolase
VRFWTIVEDLCADTATSRTWLRRNGAELHRYGADVRSR